MHISPSLPNAFCINAKGFAALQNDPLCLQQLALMQKLTGLENECSGEGTDLKFYKLI